ncbi:MAG TPA: ABC transporter substrate-binding protein [Candidatus Acidoferrum sp.]|nr:ABC transporter substrate-binding protein [Candidatus Acidoferrum sp.]
MRRTAHKPRQRIVSLAPDVTSILFALGAQADIVGVSKWCKEVAPVGRRPQVGDCWKLDVGEVMQLRPTLLIGSMPFAPETVAKLLAQPVMFMAMNPRSLADVEGGIRTLAQLVNRSRAGERLISRMRRAFEQVARGAAKIDTRPKPRVYSEAWPNPRISSPPWVAELVALAGGEFALPAGTRVTDAEVARAAPDVIILAWTATGARANPARMLRDHAFRNVPAVKNRRVVVIRDELLNTPGPPLIEGARAIFRAIHSEPRKRSTRTGQC